MKTSTLLPSKVPDSRKESMNCKSFRVQLQELLLMPEAQWSASAGEHLAACAECKHEYASLVATMSLMEVWVAPEPSPYFDQKLSVLLREEAARPKMGFLVRLRDHLLFNTGRQFRSATAGALALAVMLGGGFVGLETSGRSAHSPRVSATVNDLQTLDKDEQTLQQIDQLLQGDDATDDGASAPS